MNKKAGPVILIIGTVLAGGKALYDLTRSGIKIRNDKRQYEERRKAYQIKQQSYNSNRESAQKKFDDLGITRLHALETLGNAAKFLMRAKVKERELFEKLEVTPQQLAKWELASIQAIDLVTIITKGSMSGITSASAAYSLVGTLGVASTGTAISTLSGAAANNATLAWLGGGAIATGGGGMSLGLMVLNSIVVGPALLVSSYFVGRKAEEIATAVAQEVAKMDIAESEIDRQLKVLETILQRVDELFKSTVDVDKILADLLAKADSENLEDAYNVAKLAKSLGVLLDTAILDKNGNFIKEIP